MAAVAPPADQAAKLLQNLSLDSQAKTFDVPEATKKPSVDSNNVANGIQSDRSLTPLLPDLTDQVFTDQSMFYPSSGYPSPAYYYAGGYDGSAKEWEDYTKYMNQDGVEMTPGIYGDNGSLMYHPAYGYSSYGPYSPAASPVPTVGNDGQLYGAQHYQYPSPYFQPFSPAGGMYPTPAAPATGEMANGATGDKTAPLSVDSANSKPNGIVNNGGPKVKNGTAPAKSTYKNSSFNVNGSYGRGSFPASGYQDPRFGYGGLQSPIPWLENPYFSNGPLNTPSMTSSIVNGSSVPLSKNQNFRSYQTGLHTASGYMNSMYPDKLYGQYGNTYRSGIGYGANGYDSRGNGRGWMAVDYKYRPRGRGNGFNSYGHESVNGLNELNKGPRGKSSKNQKSFTPVSLAVKGQETPLTVTADNEEKLSSVAPDREQYNKPDFSVTYDDARFFIIKSYSEDDVHKSIKYNVWSSTPNGNKKLDAAYQDAQQRTGGCPVFLFFSVNTSGQFVGVAEMTGPVDFNKNVEYWQQDKWVGCFPVKWHVVKDVPNSSLKHITLENNENKPVTNSRDTQEVKLDQGLQVLKIFKDHVSKQCILDDFEFYEDRQKRIQEKKAQHQFHKQQAHVWEGKPVEEKTNGDLKPQDSTEPGSELSKEVTSAVQTNGENKTVENVVLKTVKPAEVAAEKKEVVANGIANGC